MAEDSLLPRVVLLDLTTASGAHPGDAVALYRRGEGTAPAGSGEQIASGVVLRINQAAATVFIVRETRGATGGPLVAKLGATLP